MSGVTPSLCMLIDLKEPVLTVFFPHVACVGVLEFKPEDKKYITITTCDENQRVCNYIVRDLYAKLQEGVSEGQTVSSEVIPAEEVWQNPVLHVSVIFDDPLDCEAFHIKEIGRFQMHWVFEDE